MKLRNLIFAVALITIAMPLSGCDGSRSGPIEASQSEMDAYKAQKAEDARKAESLASAKPGEL